MSSRPANIDTVILWRDSNIYYRLIYCTQRTGDSNDIKFLAPAQNRHCSSSLSTCVYHHKHSKYSKTDFFIAYIAFQLAVFLKN